jgi:hypothetical protein
MKKCFQFFVTSLPLLLCGCLSTKAPLSPLELRSIQEHEVEASYEVATAAVISVIQDEGFMVHLSDSKNGLIAAKSDHTKNSNFLFSHLFNGVTNSTLHRECTIHVDRISENRCRVRMNFSELCTDRYAEGQVSERSTIITNREFYLRIFEALDQAIYIHQNLLDGGDKSQ